MCEVASPWLCQLPGRNLFLCKPDFLRAYRKTINLFYLNNIIIKDVESKKNVISRTLNSIYWITFAADFKKCNE